MKKSLIITLLSLFSLCACKDNEPKVESQQSVEGVAYAKFVGDDKIGPIYKMYEFSKNDVLYSYKYNMRDIYSYNAKMLYVYDAQKKTVWMNHPDSRIFVGQVLPDRLIINGDTLLKVKL